jgi:hypothetical protein
VTTPDDESVLARVTPGAYDPAAAAEFELTRRLLLQVLALRSARVRDLERADPPDPDALAAANAAQLETARLVQDLDPDDRALVARVHAECVALLREARPA